MPHSRTSLILVLAIGLFTIAEADAHAYIDPGAASLWLQALIGGIAALIVMTRAYWRQSVTRVRRWLGRGDDTGALTR
jgi:hypothetical protein